MTAHEERQCGLFHGGFSGATLLLVLITDLCPIRGVEKNESVAQKHEMISHFVGLKEKSNVIQLLTRFNGVEVYKTELQQTGMWMSP